MPATKTCGFIHHAVATVFGVAVAFGPLPACAHERERAALARPGDLPERTSLMPAEIERVSQRLGDNLTPELLGGFDLFLYVSKAQDGPWAQRMVVFSKTDGGELTPIHVWPISTGREGMELNPDGISLSTDTPAGYFELDPSRFFRRHVSLEWKAAMPYAMFFDWQQNAVKTGLAIHASTSDDKAQLGTRASAGCVRLSADNARALFDLISTHYRGSVPQFEVDPETGTMSNDGTLAHDTDGNLVYGDGYKVLVFIDEDGGGENIATLQSTETSPAETVADPTGLN